MSALLPFRWLGDAQTPYTAGDRLVFPGVGDRADASISGLGLDLANSRYVVQGADRPADVAAILFPGLTALDYPIPGPGGVVPLTPWARDFLAKALGGGAVAGAPWAGPRGRTRWLGAAMVGGADRAGVVALARSYVNVALGDPRFEEVTQGRAGAKGYSACGDLWNFVLWRLGVRDPDVVNRAEPSAGLVWHVQQNLSRPVAGSKKHGAWVTAKPGLTPKDGDLVLIGHYPDELEHAFVHLAARGGKWESADYGQVEIGSGKPSSKTVVRDLNYPKLGSRTLIGWIDLDKLPRAAASDLPSTGGGAVSEGLTAGAVVLGVLAVGKYLL